MTRIDAIVKKHLDYLESQDDWHQPKLVRNEKRKNSGSKDRLAHDQKRSLDYIDVMGGKFSPIRRGHGHTHE